MNLSEKTFIENKSAIYSHKEETLQNAINNGRCQKPYEAKLGAEDRRGLILRPFNEYKFLLCTLFFSASIVLCKMLYASKDSFWRAYSQSRNLLIIKENEFMPKFWAQLESSWSFFVDLNWLFIPAIVGLATTYFTWRIVYLDSRIPGVEPASPFSKEGEVKRTYWMGSNGYTFAVYIGVIVFFVLLFSSSSMLT